MIMIKISKGVKNAYKNKNILVTGGTGSIGLALVKRISNPRGYERFHEFLVTNDEMRFCHDIGDMYKITKKPVIGK